MIGTVQKLLFCAVVMGYSVGVAGVPLREKPIGLGNRTAACGVNAALQVLYPTALTPFMQALPDTCYGFNSFAYLYKKFTDIYFAATTSVLNIQANPSYKDVDAGMYSKIHCGDARDNFLKILQKVAEDLSSKKCDIALPYLYTSQSDAERLNDSLDISFILGSATGTLTLVGALEQWGAYYGTLFTSLPALLCINCGAQEGKGALVTAFESLTVPSKLLSLKEDAEATYDLTGVVLHNGGHWTAYVKYPSGVWYFVDDATVQVGFDRQILTTGKTASHYYAAALVFQQRKDGHAAARAAVRALERLQQDLTLLAALAR